MNLIASLPAKADSLSGQFLRYFLVGGVAFVADFTLLFVLTEFGHVHYLLSASIAFMAGIAVNYALSVGWVFDQRSVDNRLHEFVIFAVIGLIALSLNAALMWLFTELAGLHYLGSKIVAAALIFLFNFGVRKALLFSAAANKKSALAQWHA